MKKFLLIIFATFLFLQPALGDEASGEKYVISVPMIEGLDTTNISSYLKNLAAIMSRKLDCDVKAKNLVYKYSDRIIDLVIDEFEAGDADVSYVLGDEYAEYARDDGNKLAPLFMLSFNNKASMDQCVYVRKGEFKKVSELRGAKWAGPNLLPMRYMLYKNGVDEPLEEFFSSIDYGSDAPLKKLLQKLESGEIDAFSTYALVVKLSGELGKKNTIVKRLYCDDYMPSWVFVARPDMPEKRIKQFRKILLRAHKDPDFASFGFAFQMINGHFVPIDGGALEKAEIMLAVSEKNNWKAEEIAFHKKYHEPMKPANAPTESTRDNDALR